MPVIEIQDLFFRYQAGSPHQTAALKGLSLELQEGDRLILCGHSGSGKSTLVAHLNGVLAPQQGSVRVLGEDLTEADARRRIRRRVGLLFQFPEHQLFEATVYDELAFAPRQFGLEVAARVERVAAQFGLEPILGRSPASLSMGEARRVALASILTTEPEVLILDEPTAALDPGARRQFHAWLNQWHKTLVVVTHQVEEFLSLANRLVVLEAGQVRSQGTPEEILTKMVLPQPEPELVALAKEARQRGLSWRTVPARVDDCEQEILAWLQAD